MNTIRPSALPLSPQTTGGNAQDAAKLAAARAFFAAAMGQTPASAPAQAAVEPASAAPASRTTAPTEAPQKVLRPGSLIDIRV